LLEVEGIMISVIMFSRNDDYGINLYQRTLLSLNLWADSLSLQDEIIFIDDNTDAGKVTLPEAIRDSLTPRCKSLLRILKVTPEVHESFGVSVPVAEQHCRNIGIRNTGKEWIIMTTNDNISFNLYPTIHDLSFNIWCSWVQRVPPMLWVPIWSHTPLSTLLHQWDGLLPRHVGRYKEFVHPKTGDMLIAPRELYLEVKGLEEGMTGVGCGEDTVMKKAQNLGYEVKSCADRISLFHLDHGIPHSSDGSLLNDRTEWVTNLTESRNPDTWGQYPVEEIKL
jgi:hypothetical protein